MLFETTVVTAYYPMSNKGLESIKRFCKVPCALILFTNETCALELHQWRRDFLDRTQIIVRPALETYDLMWAAVDCNRFQSKWFVWCDSNLGHYDVTFPSEVPYLCVPGRMTFLEVERIPDTIAELWRDGPVEGWDTSYKKFISGRCIVGDAEAWAEFYKVYKASGKDTILFAILMGKKTKPFRLFHGGSEESLVAMLAGVIDAPLDVRFDDGKGI